MRTIFQNAAFVSVLTFVSRILGVLRDALIAMIFGASLPSDAFFIAFRPFDLLRKMFSDGILSISFVPVFSGYMEKGRKDQAIAMFLSALFILSVGGVLLVSAGIFLAPILVKIIAPGFVTGSYIQGLTLILLKIMLPYLLSIMGIALCMGVLNSLGNFSIPAATPIVLNLVVILSALFVSSHFDPPILGLALGVTLGGIVQLALQVPFLINHGMLDFSRFTWLHPGVVRVGKIMLPCMVGAASYQINIMIASFFASQLSQGSISFLYYADRLVQFPLALFAVSFSTVLLPSLSRKAARGSGVSNEISDHIAGVFTKGAGLVFFVTIPAMAGLMALATPIVSFLFKQGAFDLLAVQNTSTCLFYLALGLWACTGTRLFVTLHYSLSSIRLPFIAGLFSIGINVILCWFLIEPMGFKGLALSVSIASMAGFALLFMNMPGTIYRTGLIVSACRALFLSVIMFCFVRWAAGFLLTEEYGKLGLGAGIFACILLGVLFFLLAGILTASPEIKMIKQMCKKNNSNDSI
ncbi:MAG: murein biosynthesis integral membrane protein MurJ [Desulfobacteraceae bacterium]|nr:murein biosynthesis integral membrane protein MurJ [Desulfobacteraceae bacterium]